MKRSVMSPQWPQEKMDSTPLCVPNTTAAKLHVRGCGLEVGNLLFSVGGRVRVSAEKECCAENMSPNTCGTVECGGCGECEKECRHGRFKLWHLGVQRLVISRLCTLFASLHDL